MYLRMAIDDTKIAARVRLHQLLKIIPLARNGKVNEFPLSFLLTFDYCFKVICSL